LAAREKDGRLPLVVLTVQIGASIDEALDELVVAELDSPVEWRVALLLDGIDVGTLLNESHDDLVALELAREMQCSHVPKEASCLVIDVKSTLFDHIEGFRLVFVVDVAEEDPREDFAQHVVGSGAQNGVGIQTTVDHKRYVLQIVSL